MRSDVIVVDLVERQVNHQPAGGGAVPVLLVGLDVHTVAGTDDLDGSAAALTQPDPLGDEEALPERVTMPGRAGTGHEVHQIRLDPRRG